MGLVLSPRMGGYLLNTFDMFILVVNAILFIVVFFFIVIASKICKRFLLLFLCMIFVLLIRIFMSGELSLSLLCFVIICCFMALTLER